MLRTGVKALLNKRHICFIRKYSEVSNSYKFEPNTFYGILTDYGWFAVPKRNYAADWTIPQVNAKIQEKYPDIDTNPRSFDDIQAVVSEWVKQPKPTPKPKPTRISKADQEKLDKLLLYKKQTKSVDKDRAKAAKQEAKETKKQLVREKRQSKAQEKADYYKYILEHGKLPESFDYSKVSYTSAWNHFAAKNYKSQDGVNTKEKRAGLSVKWQSMSPEEKKQVRDEYIDHLKKGLAYIKGDLVPLKAKIKRLKYQLPTS